MQKIEPIQFENLFEERLRRYDSDRTNVSNEQEEQKDISAKLVEANTAFTNARQGDSSTRQREQALQRLENGYVKYKEIVTNLNTGRKFYNDLASIVNRFRDSCKKFAYQRRVEAGQFEMYMFRLPLLYSCVFNLANEFLNRDLSTSLSNLSLSKSNHLQDQKERETLRQHYSAPAPADPPLTAPTPTRAPIAPLSPASGTWNPEMGIKFGGSNANANAGAPGPSGGDVRNLKYPNAGGVMKGGQWDGTRGVRFG